MNTDSNPLVSVIMPVYNGEKYLAEAIQSILNQTYIDFEFIIINDGSIDNTSTIIRQYSNLDKRIKIVNIKNKKGISNAMNMGIKSSLGKYIIRTDADDICLSDRFDIQVKYILKHKNVDVLGTYFATFSDQKKETLTTIPAMANDIYNARPPVHHPTCLIKHDIFNKYGYYKTQFDNAEDVELWFRWFSQGVKFDNIPEVLYKKRIHSESVSISKIKSQTYLLFKINVIAIFKYHIKFTLKGYLHTIEQLLYFTYLSLHLDKLYIKNKSVYNIKQRSNINE